MAASIPASLKTQDITPFITRGAQLEKARPLIAYWCKLRLELYSGILVNREFRRIPCRQPDP
jgi:hypothetical protein